MSTHDIEPAAPDWDEEVRGALLRSSHLVLIATKSSAFSRYVKAEIAVASAAEIPVLPLWTDGRLWPLCAPLSLVLSQHIDCRGDQQVAGFARAVRWLKGEPEPAPSQAPIHHHNALWLCFAAAALVAAGLMIPWWRQPSAVADTRPSGAASPMASAAVPIQTATPVPSVTPSASPPPPAATTRPAPQATVSSPAARCDPYKANGWWYMRCVCRGQKTAHRMTVDATFSRQSSEFQDARAAFLADHRCAP
jgi:hypothetical protein